MRTLGMPTDGVCMRVYAAVEALYNRPTFISVHQDEVRGWTVGDK